MASFYPAILASFFTGDNTTKSQTSLILSST